MLGDSSLHLNGDIQITQYRAGHYKCSDQYYPQGGNVLSQDGSYELNKSCGYSSYKDIDTHYYGSFVGNTLPPVPNTSYSTPTGGVKLNFPSQVADGNGHVSNVGWKYKCVVISGGCAWTTIYAKSSDWSSRNLPTSFTYHTSTCYAYRANAGNPIGTSQYASFSNGGYICPG